MVIQERPWGLSLSSLSDKGRDEVPRLPPSSTTARLKQKQGEALQLCIPVRPKAQPQMAPRKAFTTADPQTLHFRISKRAKPASIPLASPCPPLPTFISDLPWVAPVWDGMTRPVPLQHPQAVGSATLTKTSNEHKQHGGDTCCPLPARTCGLHFYIFCWLNHPALGFYYLSTCS